METYVLLATAVILLVLALFAQQVYFEVQRDKWWDERRELNNRLMSRNFGEFIALEQTSAETAKQDNQKPVEKTTNYDGAWTA